jgi:hypothetical protein
MDRCSWFQNIDFQRIAKLKNKICQSPMMDEFTIEALLNQTAGLSKRRRQVPRPHPLPRAPTSSDRWLKGKIRGWAAVAAQPYCSAQNICTKRNPSNKAETP